MYNNSLLNLPHRVLDQLWVEKVNKAHEMGQLCPWVSTFHPQNLICKLEGTFHNGSFNAGVKMVFSDGKAWMVRFPRGGKVHKEHACEKVEMEMRTLDLIRDKASIPVPILHAWGSAVDNALGVGAFIMMDFVEGVSLDELLTDPNEVDPTRLLRADISDEDIEMIYRQFANFHLQIYRLDYDCIGSLPPPKADSENHTQKRPLTYKAHDILHNGGVNVFGDRGKEFASTMEYFQYVLDQDFAQLLHQPNSVNGPRDARNRYLSLKVTESLLPDLIHPEYNKGKGKLICDDLGLANLIVRSREDLTVVGIVDLEWSYIGPAQLFGSAPWWLLQDRPINEEWEWQDDKPPELAERYLRYLSIYERILQEEEAKMPGHEAKELSSLVRWSRETGAMWMHMLLSVGFNDHTSFPFSQLRQHVGEEEWERRKAKFERLPELEAFVTRKTRMLEEYDAAVDKMESEKDLVDAGEMTREAFLAMYVG